jgi:hypothetical protein
MSWCLSGSIGSGDRKADLSEPKELIMGNNEKGESLRKRLSRVAGVRAIGVCLGRFSMGLQPARIASVDH